jgi:hypothetical protein
VKGDKYAASIAWLPAEAEAAADTGSVQPSKAAAAANGHTAAAPTSSSSSSNTAAGGQLPVSSARAASVSTVLPDRFPGPSLSLQDFPQQGGWPAVPVPLAS